MTSLGKEVAIDDIDSELRAFWSSESESTTRASLMNFVVYSEDEDSLERNTGIVSEITAEHSCRAILVSAHCADCEAGAKAWITAHCQLSQSGGKSVCSEQIAFELRGPAARLLRNIVFSHLDSDLPLVVWWQGQLSDTFGERLYSTIDRLIVDSTYWNDPLAQYEKLRKIHARHHFILHDMTWTRSHSIRIALASAFDQAELWRSLGETTRLSISIGQEFRLSALYVVAWLWEQLDWKWNGGLDFTNAEGQSIAVEIAITNEDTAHFSRFEVAGSAWSVSAARITKEARYLHLHTRAPFGENRRLFPAGKVNSAQRITEQLARAGQNKLYQKIIPKFCDLMTF